MGLLTLPFRLPLLPVQGVIRLAELLQEEAERQLYDPSSVRREVEEAERQREAGEISEDEMAERQEEALGRITTVRDPVQDGL